MTDEHESEGEVSNLPGCFLLWKKRCVRREAPGVGGTMQGIPGHTTERAPGVQVHAWGSVGKWPENKWETAGSCHPSVTGQTCEWDALMPGPGESVPRHHP